MSPRTPIILGVLCVALVAALWVLAHVAPDRASQRTRTLSPLSAAQVERLTVSAGARTCSVARTPRGGPADWAFVDGAAGRRVDAAVVEAGLAELELATRAGHVEGVTPGASHGLQPPKLTLMLFGRDGRQLVVGFGGEAGPGRVFAAVDDRLFVVPTRLSTVWGRGCDDLIDLRLFERTQSFVRRIRIGEMTVARTDEDADWRTSPEDALADSDVVAQILGAFATLRGAAPDGGSALALELEDGGRRQRAAIPATSPDAVRLLRLAARLPSRHALSLRAATVSRVALAHGDEHVLLARSPSEDLWLAGRAANLDAPLTGFVPADEALVRTFLAELTRLRVEERLAPAPTNDTAQWRLRVADDRRVHELELRPHKRGQLLLSVRGFGARYVVSSAPFERLAATVLHWRARALWSVPAAAVDAVTVGEVELRRDAGFRWQRSRPSPAEADPTRMRELVRLMRRPAVDAFAPSRPLVGPTLTLAIETVDGTTRHRHQVQVALTATPDGHACLVENATAYLPTRLLSRIIELAR